MAPGDNSADRWQRIQELFDRATALPEDRRHAFVESESRGDAALRDEVLALLTADSEESLVIGSRGDIAGLADLDRHLEGSAIGAYRLIRRIGVGGMGSVFLAERADGAFERQVALKVVRKGMDTELVVRRFEMERQILARLDHPNIAQLLDGGVTEDGRPYFVMEYVEGVPVTEYCDQRRLGVRRRLDLFRTVCAAVHYAHQLLIVHRDLKPSNILVTADGTVKLLDFGIAKLLGESADNDLTRTGMAVLTPAYASPEQLLEQPVTTVTDVYALGVILYELLSGRRPYEVRRTPAEMRDQVLSGSPPKPSTAITLVPAQPTDDAPLTADQVGTSRNAPVARLRQSLKGDLDTICLKAINREPSHRYSSADEMAADIARHLDGLPVIARPDSVAYRFGKFVRRHRLGVAAATIVLAAFGSVVAFYTAELRAERDVALEERRKVNEVVAFVTGLFEVTDPSESRGEEITARELLEAGAARIETELADRPTVQATMMRVLADVYYSLGNTLEAERFAARALERQLAVAGAENLETATSRIILGFVHQDRGEYEVAEAQFRQSLATRREILGDDNVEVMESLSALAVLEETRGDYDAAEALHEQVLDTAQRTWPDGEVVVAEAMAKLAGLYRLQDRAAEAEPLLRDAIVMLDEFHGGPHPETAKTKRQLAGLLRNTGRFEEAEPIYLEVIDVQTRMLGPNHGEVAVTWNSYSQLLDDVGRDEEALAANRKMIEILEAAPDGPQPNLGPAYNNLAFMLRDAGRYDEAIEYFWKALAVQDAIGIEARHPNRSFPTTGIADTYVSMRRYGDAEPIYRDMLELRRDAFGEAHRLTSEIKSALGGLLTETGGYEEAEALLLDAYGRFDDDRGATDPRTQTAAGRLAALYEATGRPELAARYADAAGRDEDGP